MWTISPQLLHLSPDWLRWYFAESYKTKADYFVMPPSGDTYAYPGEMRDDDQQSFVESTERDATLLNTSGTVEWEFFGTWGDAVKRYFPKYTKNGIVRGFFAVNVPYMCVSLSFSLFLSLVAFAYI